MNKLDLQTPDFTSVNIARLAELFPNCVTETKNPDGTLKRAIDFDLLSQELSHDLVEGPQERYRLDWPGKREALALANAPIRKTLRPARDESVDFDTTRNLYIEGDNLDALKLLQETYLGQVKMIYIDPPYNTGNDFIYDDDFSMSRSDYQESSGEVDEEGRALFDEEKWKQNSTSNGRFHSEWLSMMYPRLKLARNLLREDGVIFVSIDDGEVGNLRKICDEVFGEVNFIGVFVWDGGRKNDARLMSSGHDYIIVYAKNSEVISSAGTRWRERKPGLDPVYKKADELLSLHGDDFDSASKALQYWFNSLQADDSSREHQHYRMLDSGGPWYGDNISSPNYRKNLIFEFKGYSPPRNGWRYDVKAMERLEKQGLLHMPGDTSKRIQYKRYLRNTETQSPKSVFYIDRRGATKELAALLGEEVFDFPKSPVLLSRLISAIDTRDDIILDFFSGSATTAHAVMQLNAEDGGTRRHIMVQLPEPCDEKSEAFKAGYKTIAEIGKERIRRAGARLKDELRRMKDEERGDELFENSAPRKSKTSSFNIHPSYLKNPQGLDVGFRVLKIDSSNMADVYYQPDELTQDTLALHVDNLKPDRKPEDLLFQVLLDWGVDLALPIAEEKIEGRRVFFVDDNALAACFDTGLDEDFVKILAKRAPLRAVFRDAGYASDAAKINIEQIFKALSPHTELKTL
jgi:adenine-specific DNA-methyltransferase